MITQILTEKTRTVNMDFAWSKRLLGHAYVVINVNRPHSYHLLKHPTNMSNVWTRTTAAAATSPSLVTAYRCRCQEGGRIRAVCGYTSWTTHTDRASHSHSPKDLNEDREIVKLMGEVMGVNSDCGSYRGAR